MNSEKKQKVKIKELFVTDLARIRGGQGTNLVPHCPQYTTLACGEEPNGCSGC